MEFDFQEAQPTSGFDFKPEGDGYDPSPSLKRLADKSFMGRAADVVLGVPETAADMILNIPSGVESLGRRAAVYGKEALSPEGITLDTEKRAQEAGQDTWVPQYHPKTETGKAGKELVGNLMEKGMVGATRGPFGMIARELKLGDLTPEQLEIADNVNKLLVEGVMTVEGARAVARGMKKKEPAEEPTPEKQVDTTKYNQTEFDFQEGPPIPPEVRSPYNLTPEQIAKAEQELNPPTEQRVAGQGELFTPERALTPDELQARQFPLEEAQVGARDRIMTPEAERLQMDTPARVGEMEARVGPPDQALGGMEGQRGLPFEQLLSDLGTVGQDRARRVAEMEKERPIPYSPVRGPRRRQGGFIHPDLLGGKVADLIKAKGPREAIKRFVGTFKPDQLRHMLEETRDPTSRQTLAWLTPEQFNKLANARYGYEDISPSLKKSIEKGLDTKEGLRDIPYLKIDNEGRVVGHEGRHRMDVFKEKGLDLIPVRLISDSLMWGSKSVADRPKVLKAEGRAADPSFSIEFPTLLRDQMKQQDILSKHRPMARQTGAVDFFGNKTKKSVSKKGIVKTLQDMKTMFTFDRRPLAKLIEEEGITPETITDLAGQGTKPLERADRLLQTAGTQLAIDRQLAILSESKGPIGKIIKWVVDNQNAINQKTKLRIEEAIEVGLKPWKKLKQYDPKGLREALTIWQENIGKAPLREESFKNPKQWEVYKAVSEQMHSGWQRVNEARAAAGLKAIDFVENYFPAIREGDYWVHMKDSAGELRWSSAFNTAREAQKARDIMAKEYGKEFDVSQPTLQKKGPYDLSSFSAFEETLRANLDDPIRNAIQAKYNELVGKRGFGKTGIMRKNIGGAMGFEPGVKGVKNAEHVLESYFKRQESYIANLERAQLQKQVGEVPRPIWDKAPIAKQYIDDYLQRARGAELDALPMVRQLTEAVSTEILGLGRNAPRKFVQNVSSIMSLFWLVTPRFLLSQFAQPLNAMAKLTDMYQMGDTVTNPAHAFFDGLKEAVAPDATALEARQWARKNGYLESTIVSLLELKMHDLKGEKWRLVEDAARWSLGQMEARVVRAPVFHMFEKALRREIPDSKARFEVAANMMDNYMVHYDRESGPLAYDKGGIAGEMARPLKTYAHNYFGQFFEYAQTFKDQGRVAPLATMIGTQVLVSGMKGVILVAEATAIITALNAVFDMDIPTPEQLLLESGAQDWMIYGGYSDMIGRDISTTMASPAMPGMFNFPPAEFTIKAVKDSWNYLRKSISGTATDQDAMKAMLAVTPTAMRGWIEAYYSEPGMPIPKPNEKMKGDFRAPTETDEQFFRFGLGLKSIDEAKANAIARATKQLLQRDVDQRLSAIDAIVDTVKNGQEIPPALIQKYIAEGGNVQTLTQNIIARMKEQNMTFTEREQAKRPSPNQLHRLETMKRFLDEEVQQKFEQEAVEGKGMGFKKMGGRDSEGNIKPDPSSPGQMANFRELRSQARAMFPNDLEKQKKWLMYNEEMIQRQDAELKGFQRGIQQRRRQNNYMEM